MNTKRTYQQEPPPRRTVAERRAAIAELREQGWNDLADQVERQLEWILAQQERDEGDDRR